MKIIFMGTPDFALPSLQKLYSSSHHIAGIVTQPDRPRGRGKKLMPPPVKQYALDKGITNIWQPEKLTDEKFQESLRQHHADVFVVVAFRILPETVFTMPEMGTVNVHPSLLPRYRGAAPINWTIIRGEKETGVTIIKISREIDAGGIMMQERVPIGENETAGELHDRLAVLGADLLLSAMDEMESGTAQVVPQDSSFATPAPKLNREDCHLSFHQPAEQVKNWIHGLSPLPTAFAYLNQQRIAFFRAEVVHQHDVPEIPGTVIQAGEEGLQVCCEPGVISVLELQKEGKKRMSVEEFLRGFQISAGDRFI